MNGEDFKTKLLSKLEGIKESYEDGSKLGEYAKGRHASIKMVIDIVKTEQNGNNTSINSGKC